MWRRGGACLEQVGPILAADEAFKLLNEQSDNHQPPPSVQPFATGPEARS